MFGWDAFCLPAECMCKSVEVPFGGLIWMQRFSIIGPEPPSLSPEGASAGHRRDAGQGQTTYSRKMRAEKAQDRLLAVAFADRKEGALRDSRPTKSAQKSRSAHTHTHTRTKKNSLFSQFGSRPIVASRCGYRTFSHSSRASTDHPATSAKEERTIPFPCRLGQELASTTPKKIMRVHQSIILSLFVCLLSHARPRCDCNLAASHLSPPVAKKKKARKNHGYI